MGEDAPNSPNGLTEAELGRLATYKRRDFVFSATSHELRVIEHLLGRSERHNAILSALLIFSGIIIAAATLFVASDNPAFALNTVVERVVFSACLTVLFAAAFLCVYGLSYRRFRYHASVEENMYRLRRELRHKYIVMNWAGRLLYLGFFGFSTLFLYTMWTMGLAVTD